MKEHDEKILNKIDDWKEHYNKLDKDEKKENQKA
jgi:hypothetical protein